MTGAGPGLAAQANVQERPLLPENHPLLPSGDTAMAETRDEQRLWKRFVDSRFMMLTTITSDDAPYSCPMTLQRAQDGALWFFTSDESPTVKHLERVLRVGVSVMDNDDSFYFAGYGNARIMRDRAAMAPLFNAMVKAWFPAGMDDPHLVLLKVELERAEYWDNASNRMVQALAIAKSLVTGKPPADIGDHGELDPAAQPARTPVGV
jgi:general stress protein 26